MSKKVQAKNETPIPCKLILVGESGVGKTSIISRYLNMYQEKTDSTLGAYFSNKIVIVDDYKINFEIWDTAGQEKYRSINNLFYKDSHICLLVYDITNKSSFNCIRDYWYEAVLTNGKPDIIFGIAGNKSDLYEDEEVNEKEVEEFANEINASFKLTSAQVNTSIDDIFYMLGEKYIQSDFVKELLPKLIKKDNASQRSTINNNIKIQKEDTNINNDSRKTNINNNNNNKIWYKCC